MQHCKHCESQNQCLQCSGDNRNASNACNCHSGYFETLDINNNVLMCLGKFILTNKVKLKYLKTYYYYYVFYVFYHHAPTMIISYKKLNSVCFKLCRMQSSSRQLHKLQKQFFSCAKLQLHCRLLRRWQQLVCTVSEQMCSLSRIKRVYCVCAQLGKQEFKRLVQLQQQTLRRHKRCKQSNLQQLSESLLKL